MTAKPKLCSDEFGHHAHELPAGYPNAAHATPQGQGSSLPVFRSPQQLGPDVDRPDPDRVTARKSVKRSTFQPALTWMMSVIQLRRDGVALTRGAAANEFD